MTSVPPQIRDLAARYTEAWCSHDPARVAGFFSPIGSLRINNGAWVHGRHGIAEVTSGLMHAFPDMQVRMDGLVVQHNRVVYRWTMLGAHSGDQQLGAHSDAHSETASGVFGGAHRVRISGFEEWELDFDGLISEAQRHYDNAVWQHQVQYGSLAPRFFDEDEVRARLRMPELIDAMERALVEFSAGDVRQPVRAVLEFGAERSLFGLMPSYVPSLPALGAKLVTVCAGNAGRGLDAHQAVIVMLNPATGVAEAVLDGRYITEVRTAAVSAVSARLLARSDSKVLGILGSGVQARSHLEALKLVRDFGEVRVWSPNAERLQKFAAETRARAMENAEAVVRGADVVVAATASPTPVIESDWVDDGAHVIAVGACLPSQRELDPLLVARARLVVDSREAALKEAGDVVIGIAEGRWTKEHISAELGELPVRRNDREVTVFKSLGLAVEDLFAAHLVLTHAGRV
jgi:alanine dehydrogenase